MIKVKIIGNPVNYLTFITNNIDYDGSLGLPDDKYRFLYRSKKMVFSNKNPNILIVFYNGENWINKIMNETSLQMIIVNYAHFVNVVNPIPKTTIGIFNNMSRVCVEKGETVLTNLDNSFISPKNLIIRKYSIKFLEKRILDLTFQTRGFKHVKKIIQNIEDINVITRFTCYDIYINNLRNTKICISPSIEPHERDYEAIYSGALLIKPYDDGEYITFPNIYVKDKYYIPCKYDYSDLSEIIPKILKNYYPGNNEDGDELYKYYITVRKNARDLLMKYQKLDIFNIFCDKILTSYRNRDRGFAENNPESH